MKTINKKTLLPALLFFMTGICCFLIPEKFSDAFVLGAGVISFLSCLPFLIHGIKWKRSMDLIGAAACLIFSLVCFFNFHTGYYLIAGVYGFYLLAIGIVFLIQWYLEHFKASLGVLGFLYFITGAFILIFNKEDFKIVQYVIGAYCFLQAFQLIEEYYCFTNPYDVRYFSFRHWACLPAFVVGVLPSFVISYLQDRRLKKEPTHFDGVKNDKPVNLRIWVHTGTYSFRLYGHMTFSRDDLMYSYGDYDVAQEKLFKTIGPGIFFNVNSEVYINNCCIVEQCPVFEYGIHLTKEQEEKFVKMAQEIHKNTIPWMCPMEEAIVKNGEAQFKNFESDYASRLWYRTDAKFRKYTKGPWAWYTLLGNNCSNFAAAKLNEIGLNLPVSIGIVSPGEFFDVLETAYRDPNSNVISRSWHSAVIPSTLFPTGD